MGLAPPPLSYAAVALLSLPYAPDNQMCFLGVQTAHLCILLV